MLDKKEIAYEYLEINSYYKQLSSEELKVMMKDKSVWDHYQHIRKLFNKNKKEWKKLQGKDSRLTYEVINDELGNFNGVIADFGCGGNELAKLRKNNKVYAFDFYACDENVIPCCLTDVPLPNEKVDVVVISLALSTTDYHKVLEEAYRVLKPSGLLKIVLFGNSRILGDVVRKHLPRIGFVVDKMTPIDNLIYIDSVKN